MKKIVMASAMMASVAMANDMDSRPEASVPTPVERHAAVDNVPNFSEKESGDWQKMREERRAARQQILQNLRENSAAEKRDLRGALEKGPEPPKAEVARDQKLEQKQEQKQEEMEWMKNPNGFPPFGGPENRFNPKRGNIWNPGNPFNPRKPEKCPKGEWPKREDFEKGNSPR